MLKQSGSGGVRLSSAPAAFRRLCVETAFLTPVLHLLENPAAFRRLCVETTDTFGGGSAQKPSRLQAAVC